MFLDTEKMRADLLAEAMLQKGNLIEENKKRLQELLDTVEERTSEIVEQERIRIQKELANVESFVDSSILDSVDAKVQEQVLSFEKYCVARQSEQVCEEELTQE